MSVINNPAFLKRMHLFPNIITAFGLICGLFVIFKMAVTDVTCHNFEVLQFSAIILLLAAAADLLDGAVARLMGAESDFGVFFDSVADSITFGVAPSVIVLTSLNVDSDLFLPLMITSLIYSLCGVLRLVRFSVEKQHVKENKDLADEANKNFTGLPIPGAAAAAVSANLFLASKDCEKILSVTLEERAIILSMVMLGLGYFMISRWKFPSLKALHIRISAFPLIVLTVSTFSLFLYGILQHFAAVFASVSWGYVILAWVLSLIRLISGKKSKTLEDFEPEPEEFE
jgi:CDP-diacylglycerol---serine O-phosphatidyltransferase